MRAVVVIVRVESAPNVPLTGEKLQLAPAGKPVQESATAPLKPLPALSETRVFTELPAVTAPDVKDSERLNASGCVIVTLPL